MSSSRKNFKDKISIIILSIVLLTGIIVASFTINETEESIFTEHDDHIYDIASSIDHSLSDTISVCFIGLDMLYASDETIGAEKSFFEDGDDFWMKDELSESTLLGTKYVKKLLLMKDDEILLSSDDDDDLSYSFLDEDDGDRFRIINDDSTGEMYFTIFTEGERGNISYYALIDPNELFDKVVPARYYNEYWIVLYDIGSGLTIHNQGYEHPLHVEFFKEDELLARNDGLTLVYEVEKQNIIQSGNYDYISASDGKVYPQRITTIASQMSENGNFTVACAVDQTALVEPANRRFTLTILSAIAIAFSAAGILYSYINLRRREKGLSEKVGVLEEENKLAANLLEQQRELAHHQKLETIGILTAGVAHEFNNLLSPIMSDSLLILENADENDPNIFDNAAEIYESSRRAKELVAKISILSRKNSKEEMSPIHVDDLVTNVLGVSKTSLPKNISYETRLKSSATILGNESQLTHMILNLLINSNQAIGSKEGKVIIETWDDESNANISVADNGCGIPEENLSKIFEPFFTSKESGKGTGLGLSIVQRTVTLHNGTIKVENLKEGGSRFTIALPKNVED